MARVVGVRFREVGKVYYFDPVDDKFEKGDHVIVETVRGIECGEIALENSDVDDSQIVKPLKKVVRRATEADLKVVSENRVKEQEAFDICIEKIAEHGLDMMKLVNVEYAFDGSKILFYYTSDVRVDFRELVKDLARVFRTRIELRQIGVRDGSKMLGGLGMCGRPFCCSTFLGDFQPVSIKMAKEQGLSLNPVKISGTCGRLMCCLKYEQDTYEHLLKITPKQGAIVDTPEGKGVVVETNLISGVLKVRLDRCPEAAPHTFGRREVKIIKDAQIKVNRSEMEAFKDIEG
ncbi:MAG: stage 0 sporulation family protein [Clostridia bacterium]|nr:stage 0 sporulation family protein [Clostridia bacterium]